MVKRKCSKGVVKTGVRKGQCRKVKMTPAHRLAIDKSKTAKKKSKAGGRRSDNKKESLKCKFGKLSSPRTTKEGGKVYCKKKPKGKKR